METLKQIILTIRDLLIPILPRFIVRLLVGKCDFVFMAHAIDLSDFSKKYPFSRWLTKDHLKIFSRYLWTIIGSKITGFRLKDGTISNGWLIFCPLSTRVMVLKRDMARRKILRAAKFAEKLDVKILGLGAFIPILADDGFFLKDKVSMSITTGNSFSAVIAAKNVIEISKRIGLDMSDSKLAIVGAAGSVGSVCSNILANFFKYKVLIDKNLSTLEKMRDKLFYRDKGVIISASIKEIKEADVILAVTNVPGVVVRSSHLKQGAVVVDAAQPKNVSIKIPKERNDVLVIESGIAEVDNVKVNFDLGLRKQNEVYSCLGEILLMLWLNKIEDHLGEMDISYVNQLMDVSEYAGVRLAEFRNCLGFIEAEDISRIGDIIKHNKSKSVIRSYN